MYTIPSVSEVSAVGQGGPGFDPQPGRDLNLLRPSFATPSVDRDLKLLV